MPMYMWQRNFNYIMYNLPVLEIAGNALLMTFHVATDAYVAKLYRYVNTKLLELPGIGILEQSHNMKCVSSVMLYTRHQIYSTLRVSQLS